MKHKMQSKDLIAMALYELLYKGKSIDKISISELCQKAGVSRMSFYRSYDGVKDIIVSYCDERFEEFYREYIAKESDMKTLLSNILIFIKSYQRQFKLLADNKLENIFLEQLYSYVKYVTANYAKAGSPSYNYLKNPLANSFFAGGLNMVIIQWSKTNMTTPVEEIVDNLTKLIGA